MAFSWFFSWWKGYQFIQLSIYGLFFSFLYSKESLYWKSHLFKSFWWRFSNCVMMKILFWWKNFDFFSIFYDVWYLVFIALKPFVLRYFCFFLCYRTTLCFDLFTSFLVCTHCYSFQVQRWQSQQKRHIFLSSLHFFSRLGLYLYACTVENLEFAKI